jgi:small subunit ribosomal protein S13
MPRLLGVDIPNDKQVVYSLQYLYGVGPAVAREACVKTKIELTKRARDLDEDELSRLASLLERDYTVEGPLRRQVLPWHAPQAWFACPWTANSNQRTYAERS